MFRVVLTLVVLFAGSAAFADEHKLSTILQLVMESGFSLVGSTEDGQAIYRAPSTIKEATAQDKLVATGFAASVPKVARRDETSFDLVVRVKGWDRVDADEKAWTEHTKRLSPALALSLMADSRLYGMLSDGSPVFEEPTKPGLDAVLAKFIATGRLAGVPKLVDEDGGKYYIAVRIRR